jgi:hypothetical protein
MVRTIQGWRRIRGPSDGFVMKRIGWIPVLPRYSSAILSAAPETSARHPAAIHSTGQPYALRRMNHRIKFRTTDLEIVPQRAVARRHEPAQFRPRRPLEGINRRKGAGILGNDVPGPAEEPPGQLPAVCCEDFRRRMPQIGKAHDPGSFEAIVPTRTIAAIAQFMPHHRIDHEKCRVVPRHRNVPRLL